MKKFVSILLTAAMVIGLVPMMVSAEVVTEDFMANYAKYVWYEASVGAVAEGSQTGTAEITNEEGYSGSKSLHVTLDQSNVTSDDDWSSGVTITSIRGLDTAANKKYNIKMYVKSNNSLPTEKLANTIYFSFGNGGTVRLIDDLCSGYTCTQKENGWYEIKAMLTIPSDKANKGGRMALRFSNVKDTAIADNVTNESDLGKLDLYVDGIEVEDAETGEFYITKRIGSFEDIPSADTGAVDFLATHKTSTIWTINEPLKRDENQVILTKAEITAEEAAVGKRSLHIDFTGSTSWNQGLTVRSKLLTLNAGEEYTYTFYAKGLKTNDGWVSIGSYGDLKKLSAFTQDNCTITQEENGWNKFVITNTPAKAGVFALTVMSEECRDFYIDGLTVTKEGSTADLLNGEAQFEIKEPLTYTGENFFEQSVYKNYGWNVVVRDAEASGDTQVEAAYITDEQAYSGNKSLRMTLDQSGFANAENAKSRGMYFNFPRKFEDVNAGDKYEITAYVKSNNSVPTEKLIDALEFRYALKKSTKMTDTTIVSEMINEAVGNDGWYKIGGIITVPENVTSGEDFRIFFRNAANIATTANISEKFDLGVLDMYIDGISIKNTVTNEDLVAGRWGSFEEIESTDEAEVDFFTSYADYGWASASKGNPSTNKFDTSVMVTSAEAAVDNTSLHIIFAGSDAWNQGLNLKTAVSLTAGTTYKYTFYAKGLSVRDTAFYLGSASSNVRFYALTEGTNYTCEPADNGWCKFTVTHTPEKTGVFTLYVLGTGPRDLYIDGLTVTEGESTADLLGGIGNFEEESDEPIIPDPEPDPDPDLPEDPVPEVIETEDFMDATVRTSYGWGTASVDTPSTGDVQETAAVITNQAAYTGKKSLRLTLDHSGFTSDQTWQKGMYFYFLRKFDVFTEGEQLKLTAYVKSNNSVSAEKLAGAIYFRYAGNKEVRILSSEVTSASVTKGAKAGWYKLEGVITVPAGATLGDFRLSVRNAKNTATAGNGATGDDVGVLDFFIDEITLENITTGEQIIGTKWGTFEENYELPDATADNFMTDYKDYGWTTAMNENGQTNKFSTLAEVTAADAAVGNKSLHIDYAGSSVWSAGLVFRHSAQLTANKTYTYTFYTKGIGAKDAVLYFGAASDYTRLADMASGKYTAATYTMTPAEEADGWMKVVVTHTPSKDGAFTLAALGTQVRNFYIDGLTVTEQGSDVDLLDGDGNFERDAIYDYAAGTTRIFDESFNEISKLTKENGGQKIIIRNAVMNNFLTESKTAQMIIAIYDGFEIIQTIMPEQITITKDDKFKAINAEVTLPEFDSEGEYAVKVFVWDGTTNMKPLTDSVDFIVE